MKRRKLPPGTRHHEYWCAIFYGRPCNCDDDQGRPPRITRRGGAPGAEPSEPPKKKTREFEGV
jgi:hypothetical protein